MDDLNNAGNSNNVGDRDNVGASDNDGDRDNEGDGNRGIAIENNASLDMDKASSIVGGNALIRGKGKKERYLPLTARLAKNFFLLRQFRKEMSFQCKKCRRVKKCRRIERQ